MPQLDPTYFASQLFWLTVIFSLLYFMLAKVTLPGITAVLQSRRERIASDLDAADQLKEDAEELETEYRTSMEGTRAEANEMIAKANAEVHAMTVEKNAELDKTLAEQMTKAEEKIDKAREKAIEELSAVSSELSLLVVKSVSKMKVKKGEADKVIQSLLEEV